MFWRLDVVMTPPVWSFGLPEFNLTSSKDASSNSLVCIEKDLFYKHAVILMTLTFTGSV